MKKFFLSILVFLWCLLPVLGSGVDNATFSHDAPPTFQSNHFINLNENQFNDGYNLVMNAEQAFSQNQNLSSLFSWQQADENLPVPGTNKTLGQLSTELENVISTLKGIDELGPLANVLNRLEDNYASFRLNSSSISGRNVFVVENNELGVIISSQGDVTYGNLAAVNYKTDGSFTLTPRYAQFIQAENLTEEEFVQQWIIDVNEFDFISSLRGQSIEMPGGQVIPDQTLHLVRKGNQYELFSKLPEALLEVVGSKGGNFTRSEGSPDPSPSPIQMQPN